MAYSVKEEQVEHALLEKNNRGEYVRIARVIPEGNRMESVDMRIMFTSDSGEILPTKKGLRVNSEMVVDFAMALVKSMDETERGEFMSAIQEVDGGDSESILDSMDFDDAEEEYIVED